MRWPSWNEFTQKIGDFEKSADDVISSKIEKFQNNHPLLDKAIRTSIKFLPSPFDNIAEAVYDNSKGSDEGQKVEEVKNFFNDFKSQGEEHYNNITSKLDSISDVLLDIKTITAKERTLIEIKNILTGKEDTINQKLDNIIKDQQELKFDLQSPNINVYVSF